ncbi:MAG: hypothetical protein K1X51_03650 [Rhodospirillaceae bacterium]|nr:hypothetical protein [Rhodospirillaceae bacterium]
MLPQGARQRNQPPFAPLSGNIVAGLSETLGNGRETLRRRKLSIPKNALFTADIRIIS